MDEQVIQRNSNVIIHKYGQSHQPYNFLYSLKIQPTYHAIINQKVVHIIQKYYELQPQLIKITHDAHTLSNYNKKMLEWIEIFRQHQKKILDKLHKLQQINIKYMKQFCTMKNREFNSDDYKPTQSIFNSFRISQWKCEYHQQIKSKIQQQYHQKLLNVFQKYILKSSFNLQTYLTNIENQLKNHNRTQLISTIHSIKNKLIHYNQIIQNINKDNMFDIYAIKQDIYLLIDFINQQLNNQHHKNIIQIQQDHFIQKVMQIHGQLQYIDDKKLLEIVKNHRKELINLHQLKIIEVQKYQDYLQKIKNQNIDLLDENKLLKIEMNLLNQQLIALRSTLKTKQAQLEYKSMRTNPLRRMNSYNIQSSIVVDQSIINDQVRKLKVINKALEDDISLLRIKYEQIKDENLKLKETQNIIYEDQQEHQAIINVNMVQVPYPVPLFYKVEIPINNKLLQLLKTKLVEVGWQFTLQQDYSVIIQKVIQNITRNSENQHNDEIIKLKKQIIQIRDKNQKLIKEIQQKDKIHESLIKNHSIVQLQIENYNKQIIQLKKQNQTLIQKNAKVYQQIQVLQEQNYNIKNQIEKISNQIQKIRIEKNEFETELQKVNTQKLKAIIQLKKLEELKNRTYGDVQNVQKRLTLMAEEKQKQSAENKTLTEQNQKLQQMHGKAVQRISLSENMVCQAMDALMKTALAGPEEAIKEIQNSLIQLKKLLRGQSQVSQSSKKSPKNQILNENDSISNLIDKNQQNKVIDTQKKMHNNFLKPPHQRVSSGDSSCSKTSKQDKKSFISSQPQPTHKLQKLQLYDFIGNDQNKQKSPQIEHLILKKQGRSFQQPNKFEGFSNEDGNAISAINTYTDRMNNQNTLKHQHDGLIKLILGQQSQRQNEVKRENKSQIIQKEHQSKNNQKIPVLTPQQSVNLTYSRNIKATNQYIRPIQQNQHHQGDIQAVRNFAVGIIEYVDKQPSALTQQYVQTIQRKLDELKAKLRQTVDNPNQQLIQLKQRYKQTLNSLQAAEKINHDYQIEYQKLIKELRQSGTTSNSKQKMEMKIFHLQRHIKELNILLQQQKTQFQDSISKQIIQSQRVAKKILQSLTQKIQLQNYFYE